MNAAQLGGGSIKSIQRGLLTIGAGLSSGSVGVSTVDTTKSELRMLGFSTASIGTTDGYPRINLASSTVINATRSGIGADVLISWELTERY